MGYSCFHIFSGFTIKLLFMKTKRTKNELEYRFKKRLAKRFVLKYGVKKYYNPTIKKRLDYYSALIAKEFSISFDVIDDFLIKLYDLNPLGKIARVDSVNKKFTKKSRFNSFYRTIEWREVRSVVLSMYGSVCMKCGSKKNIHVDHILPISKYPKLRLDVNNLQVLCSSCNIEKSNTDYTDYRNNFSQTQFPYRSMFG